MTLMDTLTVARDEYRTQLGEVMSPHMVVVFQEIYDEAVKISKGKQTMKRFQELLKDVKNWNSNIVKGHTDTINNSCAWYNDLLAAVFVSSVKILAAVRLSAEKKKINVKIPSNETFIQGCYENAARALYKDPFIFSEEMNEFDRDTQLMERFKEAIYLTAKNMIPVQEILKTNIGDRDSEGQASFEAGGALSEDEEEEEDLEPEGEPEVEAPPALEGPTPVPEVGGAPEVKEIPLEGGSHPDVGDVEEDVYEDEEEDLAPGAPPK